MSPRHLAVISTLVGATLLTACNPMPPALEDARESETADLRAPERRSARPNRTPAPVPTAPDALVPITTTPVAPPSEAPPPTPPPAAPDRFVAAFPGDVAPGYVRWGAAVGGNSDPVARHESVSGSTLGIRRTFWRWDQRSTSMKNTAANDLAVGRLPWVSVKTPGWAAMASGAHDAEIDDMIRALDALDGPVWLTVHHEPEGGGGQPGPDDPAGAAGWRAMQIRVRQRLDVIRPDNVAFAPILMSWTFDPRSGRNPAEWWVDDIWDFAGLDHYLDKESMTTFELPMWQNARAFYTGKDMKIAVGEWGNRGTDATAAAEMQAWYDLAVASGTSSQSQVIGMAAFDSDLNSPRGGWSLTGQPLTKFRQLLGAPTSLSAHSSGG